MHNEAETYGFDFGKGVWHAKSHISRHNLRYLNHISFDNFLSLLSVQQRPCLQNIMLEGALNALFR